MSGVATNKTCERCGGDITTEQIVAKQAGLVNGVLLCPGCVEEKRKELIAAQQAAHAAAQAAVAQVGSKPPGDITDEKISLIDEEEVPKGRDAPKIRSFAAGSTLAGAHHDAHLKRSITSMSDPPTRIRTFHSKLTPAALAHMDDLINEWIDANPTMCIKLVTTSVGPFEAKHVEQHLIVNVFY
jgi:hypothetical protein